MPLLFFLLYGLNMINVSIEASEKISSLRKEEDLSSDHNLRLKVKGQGCAGFSYDLYFDDQITESDEIFEDNGIKIVVDCLSLQYLDGALVDAVDGIFGSSFKITNPNVTSTCGCGNSFSV